MNKKSITKENKSKNAEKISQVEVTTDDLLIWLLTVCNENDISCVVSSEDTVDMQVGDNKFRVQFTLLK